MTGRGSTVGSGSRSDFAAPVLVCTAVAGFVVVPDSVHGLVDFGNGASACLSPAFDFDFALLFDFVLDVDMSRVVW